MISGMPKHAQAPIRNYLETGKFKNHEQYPMENDAETQSTKANIEKGIDKYVAQDQTAGDANKTPGQLRTEEDYFGTVDGSFTKSEDGKTVESFVVINIPDQDPAVMYHRNTPEGLDVITVGSADNSDGVMHFSHTDPNGHFMTFGDL